mgnify:CR=1 FL=1
MRCDEIAAVGNGADPGYLTNRRYLKGLTE